MVEKTGYSPEAVEVAVKSHEERRIREENKARVEKAVKKFQEATARGEDPLQVVQTLEKTLEAVRVNSTLAAAPLPFSVDRLEKESRETPTGRPSGWPTLDRMDVSFNPGELAIVGARTSHGKTSFLVGLLKNWAKAPTDEGIILFYSMEEAEVSIYHRLLSLLTGGKLTGGAWSVAEVRDFLRGGLLSRGSDFSWSPPRNLEAAREALRKWEGRFQIVHRPAWNVEQIETHARGIAASQKVGAVLVDYLQRIPAAGGGSYDRRDIEVSAVARALKRLAEDVAAPIVAGCQVNREAAPGKKETQTIVKKTYEEAVEQIKKGRPTLSQLREGGSEQEADFVLGLLNYAADYQTDEGEERNEKKEVPPVTLFDVGTLKNRRGMVGRWAALNFEGRSQLIIDPSERDRF
jgi:replicative DNA helicase